MSYAELHCLSNFSFQRGASSALELFERAKAQGYSALGITDECSLAGIVRAWQAAKAVELPLIIGSEVRLENGPKLVLLVQDLSGYQHLCRLITVARRRAEKGRYRLLQDDFDQPMPGLLALWVAADDDTQASIKWLRETFAERLWLAVHLHCGQDDARHLQQRLSLAARCLSQGARNVVDKVLMLDSAGFDKLAEQWAVIHTLGQLTVEAQTSAIKVLTDTFIHRARRVHRITSAATTAKVQIEKPAVEGEGLNLEHYSDPLLAYDAARLDELEQKAVTLQLEEDQLQADKQVVIAAVTILQSRSWLDLITDLLPTAEQIQALVIAASVGKAEADVVTAALERVTQYLGFVDSGYRLFSLTEVRNKITDNLADLNIHKSRNKADMRELKERAEKIRRHAELVEARGYWVDNIRLIANGLAVFLTRLNAVIDINEHTLVQASAELAGFQRFLRRISR